MQPKPEALERIRAIYDKGLYLSAWKAAVELGDPRDWSGTSARILAGRLLNQVGGMRTARSLHLRAWRGDPLDAEATEYAAYAVWIRRGPYEAWRFLSRIEEPRRGLPEAFAGIDASRATMAGALRDFTCADRLMARALELSPESAWIRVEQASLLEMEDRLEDALCAARSSLELRPRFRPAVQQAAHILGLLGRSGEALELLAGEAEHSESGFLVLQFARLQIELGMLEAADRSLSRLAELWPVADRPLRDSVTVLRSDTAYLRGDLARAIELAGSLESGFLASVRQSMESARAEAKRVLLEMPFIRQKYMTCGATTLASIAEFWSRPADHESVVREIVYDGSRPVDERRWAEENGWRVREFTVSGAGVIELIDRGIPFALTTSDPSRSHLQAVVGYDTVRGTILLRDPGFPDLQEWLTKETFEIHAAIGPRGMALVPEEMASLFDGLQLTDEGLHDLLYQLRLSLAAHDRDAAAVARDEMRRSAPDHRLTDEADLEILTYDRDLPGCLKAMERLCDRFPDSELHAHRRIATLGNLDRRVDCLDLLRELATREAPHPSSLERYADALCEIDPDTALIQARKAIRRMCDSPTGYSVLSRILWTRAQREESYEAIRFATCLNDRNEDLANRWFAAARHLDRTDEALVLLRDRFERFGERSCAPAGTLYTALEALDQIPEALAVLETALDLRPEDGELLLLAARSFSRWGRLDDGEDLLEQARGRSRREDRLRAVAEIRHLRGDLRESLDLWRKVVEVEPLEMDAQCQYIALLRQLDGLDAALEHLDRMLEEFPRHHGLAEERAIWAREGDPARREAALNAFLDQHPGSAWALREKAMFHIENGRPGDALPLLDRAEEQEPHSIPLVNIRGRFHAVSGLVGEATRDFRQGIVLDVDNTFAIHQLLLLAGDPGEARESLAFIRSQLDCQVSDGDGLSAWMSEAQQLLDSEEILGMLEEVLNCRPGLRPAWHLIIRQLSEMDRNHEAWERAVAATDRFPLTPALWALRGEIAVLEGDEPSAVEALEHAIAVSPNWSRPRRLLSEVHERHGEFEAAGKLLRGAIAREPADAVNHGFLAEIQVQEGGTEEAIESFGRAVALDPDYVWAWERLEELATADGRPGLVEDRAQKLAECRSGEAPNWVRLARYIQGNDRTEERLEILDRAIELDPRSIAAHNLRAIILSGAGRFPEAEEACRPAVFGEYVPVALRGRAISLEAEQGNLRAAVERMVGLLAEDDTYEHGWSLLFDWSETLDDREGMRRSANRLLRLNPNDAGAHNRMAEFLDRCGESAQARSSYERASILAPGFFNPGFRAFNLAIEAHDLDAAGKTIERIHPWMKPEAVAALETLLAVKSEAVKTALAKFVRVVTTPSAERYWVDYSLNALCQAGRSGSAIHSFREQVGSENLSPEAGASMVAWLGQNDRLTEARGLVDELIEREDHWKKAANAYLLVVAHPSRIRAVRRFIDCHAEQLRGDDSLWGQAAYAFAWSGLPGYCVQWMADWQEHGAEPWMLLNLAMSLRHLRSPDEAAEISRAAVALPRDHGTASHETWLAYDAAIRGDCEEAQAHLSRAPRREVEFVVEAVHRLTTALTSFAALEPGERRRRAQKLREQLNAVLVRERLPADRKIVHRLWRETVGAAYRQDRSLMMWIYWVKSFL